MNSRAAVWISWLLAGLLVGCDARWDAGAYVAGSIDGRQLVLSPRVQHKLANEALEVLKTCSYANLHPTGEYAVIVTNALRHSHLEITFSQPRPVDIHGRFNLEVGQLVVTLPVSAGAFLVRSNQDTLYFAKFDCPPAQEMEKTLKQAAVP